LDYIPDENCYFKLYVDHYSKQIYVMQYSVDDKLINILIGNNAESLSKKIIFLELTTNLEHLNYIGRELSKAEYCLKMGKPYVQDV
jgi:dihydropteroate synthase